MPDNFLGNVIVNALGTIVGGLVLTAITSLLALWLRRVARLTDREYRKQLKRVNEFGWTLLAFVLLAIAGGLVAQIWGEFDWRAFFTRGDYDLPWDWSVIVGGVSLSTLAVGIALTPLWITAKASAVVVRWVAVTWFRGSTGHP
ncbi:MAG: hypothetical protein HOV78_20170 [Hamadaea sp.]|nr:hypothetical protein [Hamadaea sp.]NUO90598.1 hypothetical protein [Dermatophilaceae bacterium]